MWLKTPSRPYQSSKSVREAYDSWTSDGILEFYWGEHIHLGYYESTSWFNSCDNIFLSIFRAFNSPDASSAAFVEAKSRFISKMAQFGGICDTRNHTEIVDIGCGIGGTTRALAAMIDSAFVTGISISERQVERARELSIAQSVNNVRFIVEDAIDMGKLPSSAYDIVWICESSEHIADKKALLAEACRVLKPGGRLVMAAWCSRDPRNSQEEKTRQFLEQEWSHPSFASIQRLSFLLTDLGMNEVAAADWTEETIPSWYHSIIVGVWNPWPVIVRPDLWLKTIREIYTISLMHVAFRDGLMQYGMFRATKPRN